MKKLIFTILMMVALTTYSQQRESLFSESSIFESSLLENMRIDVDKPVVNPVRNNYAIDSWIDNVSTRRQFRRTRQQQFEIRYPKADKLDLDAMLKNITTVVDKKDKDGSTP